MLRSRFLLRENYTTGINCTGIWKLYTVEPWCLNRLKRKARTVQAKFATKDERVMTNVLKMIFNIDESQKDQIEQITVLACQIAESLDRGEKIDWKDKAADGGVQMVIAAICMALRMKGINI